MQKLSYSELLKQIELNLECLKLSGIDWVGKTIGNDGLLNVKDPQIPNQLSNPVDLKAIKLNPSQPAKTELTILKRGELLESLKAEVKDCGKCTQLVKTRKSVVFGGGKIEAEICFIGEAPISTGTQINNFDATASTVPGTESKMSISVSTPDRTPATGNAGANSIVLPGFSTQTYTAGGDGAGMQFNVLPNGVIQPPEKINAGSSFTTKRASTLTVF